MKNFEMFEDQELDAPGIKRILRHYRIVTFNGINFDLPILTAALQGATCEQLKTISDKIIVQGIKHWQLGLESIPCDHIDLIEVAPGIASLKIYGGRLHSAKMQDLPIEPDAHITPLMRKQLRDYCGNDLSVTLDLFNKLKPQLELREVMGQQYGMDLRSKSDAQIAEAVLKSSVEKATGKIIKKGDPFRFAGKTFKYKVPEFIEFTTQPGQDALSHVRNAVFTISEKGVVQLPDELKKLVIKINDSKYRMGIGGLHSSEKSVSYRADADHVLMDLDVASYYPSIILTCNLNPFALGEYFQPIYRSIVDKRLAAKRSGDKVSSDSLKITLNGSFGKMGSPYSVLYSPPLLIQTTITGQLALLMLIESLEANGISVISANTDGIVVHCHKSKLERVNQLRWEWEIATSFELEETRYKVLLSRDVNNYIALKTDGSHKAKGAYAEPSLQKNPANSICVAAVLEFLKHGTPLEETIRSCLDIRQFITVRTVRGGAIDQQGNYLGKAIRWYYAQGVEGVIRYKANDNTVPRSEGARPLMDLPAEFPKDVNYQWYIEEANSILKDIGYNS